MCNNELISVIVPVYNVSKYLDKCINSILSQDYKNLEIILVDDGSTDDSGSKCDEYSRIDERIRVIHKKNGGLSSARNAGLEIAKGDYIGFVDSDDWISSDMYSQLYRAINQGDYDISMCRFIRVNNENCFIQITQRKYKVYTYKLFIKKLLKIGDQESNQYAVNKLYKRYIFESVRYPEGLTDEDVEGTFRAVLTSKKDIIEVNKICYFYRINENSITAPIFSLKKLDFLTICDHLVEIAQKYNDTDIEQWSKLFRYRADFAILSRMAIMKRLSEEKDDYKATIQELIQKIRLHYFDLLCLDWPLNRKILMTMFCINYNFTTKIINFFRLIPQLCRGIHKV